MATIFMNECETKLCNYEGIKPKFYRRYVDDIFAIFENQSQCTSFLSFLNNIHKNIQFTMEEESSNELPFLDVKVFRKESHYFTTQYFKPTDTGLYVTPYSNCDEKYKTALVQTLISRTWELNTTYALADKGIDYMTKRLTKNGYDENFVIKNIKKVVDNKMNKKEHIDVMEKDNKGSILFKMQYGKGYKEMKSSLAKLFSLQSVLPSSITQPSPTEPLPTDPLPTEPLPTEPLPTEPLPTETAPTETAPTESLSTESLPTETSQLSYHYQSHLQQRY